MTQNQHTPLPYASASAFVWNVCEQDIFDDVEPDDNHTASSFPLSDASSTWDDDTSQSSRPSASSMTVPIPWGTANQFMRAPPGLLPPEFPPGAFPAKSKLWNDVVGITTLPLNLAEPEFTRTIPKAGTPMVLWCEAKPTKQKEVMEALDGYFGDQQPQFVHFPTTACFTRWLFEQPRGEVTPWGVLVVGWREAKPSAMGLRAARTGDIAGLRPDARRPQLVPIVGDRCQYVHVAVESMIIVVEKPQYEERALAWVNESGANTVGFDIHVASDLPGLQTAARKMTQTYAYRGRGLIKKTILSL